MRRYLPLLLIAFFLTVLAFALTAFLPGHADDKPTPDATRTVVLYTTSPVEEIAALTEEFEQQSGIHIAVVPLSPADLPVKLKLQADSRQADLVLADSNLLGKLAKNKNLVPYASEQVDIIPERFVGDDNTWIGVWYDPIVFAVNQDFAKKLPQVPAKWPDLVKANNYRLIITDFMAADAFANLLFTMTEVNGEEQTIAYWEKLHPKIIQYAKFLATSPRAVGLGEADIGIAVLSETLRYVKDGFPIRVVYPEEGTAFLLTGIGLTVGAPHAADAKKFIDWLVQDQAQTVLQTNRVYVIPTNPETKAYKEYNAKAIQLFDVEDKLSNEQKAKLLDKWVQSVRFSPR